jgi:NTE family protein
MYGDMHLVDGGLKNNLPTDIVRQMGADVVVAVELNYTRGFVTQSTKMVKVLTSTIGIMLASSVAPRLAMADIVLQPDLKEFSKMNMDGLEDRIKAGYDCAMASYKEIAQVIKNGGKGKKN